MKKRLLIVCFGVLVITAQLIAQEKPIMGYGKVVWGTSVDDVKKAYNIGDDVVAAADPNDDPNVIKMTQTEVSDTISKRIFLFIDDKLYRVYVIYTDVTDVNASNLESALESIYGKKTDVDRQTQQGSIAFKVIYYKTNTIIFGEYEPELEVKLFYGRVYGEIDEKNKDLLDSNQLWVCYTWKKFRDEYQTKKLEL